MIIDTSWMRFINEMATVKIQYRPFFIEYNFTWLVYCSFKSIYWTLYHEQIKVVIHDQLII